MNKLIDRIKRFFYWGWKLKDSFDWDSAYLEEVLYLKLVRMRKCFDSEDFHHNRWSLKKEPDFKQNLLEQYKADVALDICIALLKRRTVDFTYDKLSGLSEHIKDVEFKFGEDKMILIVNGSPATVEFLLKKKELYQVKQNLQDRDRKLLYFLMGEYLEGWWS